MVNTKKKTDQLMQKIDTNKDNMISFEELTEFFKDWSSSEMKKITKDLRMRSKKPKKKAATAHKVARNAASSGTALIHVHCKPLQYCVIYN